MREIVAFLLLRLGQNIYPDSHHSVFLTLSSLNIEPEMFIFEQMNFNREL